VDGSRGSGTAFVQPPWPRWPAVFRGCAGHIQQHNTASACSFHKDDIFWLRSIFQFCADGVRKN